MCTKVRICVVSRADARATFNERDPVPTRNSLTKPRNVFCGNQSHLYNAANAKLIGTFIDS